MRLPWNFLLLSGLLVIGACSEKGNPADPGGEEAPEMAPWLEVGWITRTPRIPAPSELGPDPKEGWPEVGSPVTWQGVIINRREVVVEAIPYSWFQDGEEVASGTVDLPPGLTAVDLPWDWTFQRHEISLRIQPPQDLGDYSAEDDSLTIHSDAISVGFWVEEQLYQNIWRFRGVGFERWAQGQLDNWNAILARSWSEAVPGGAKDRLRLDWVKVIPNGENPWRTMRAADSVPDTDLLWFFKNHPRSSSFMGETVEAELFADQTVLFHELLHQRGLTDLYAYYVAHYPEGDNYVLIQEGGELVAGTPIMPVSSYRGGIWGAPLNGLMGTRYDPGAQLTEHSLHGLNHLHHRRTPYWRDQFGNLVTGTANNNLKGRQCYVNLLPSQTRVRLLDAGSELPLSSAEVEVFLDHDPRDYNNFYDSVPDFVFHATDDGVSILPDDLLDETPSMTEIPKSMVAILRIRASGGRAYHFLPLYELNNLYFRHDGGPAELDLRVELR